MEGNRIRLASDFYITRDGTPAASIVVRTGAPDKVMEAARDLQDIIRRMRRRLPGGGQQNPAGPQRLHPDT